MARCRVGASSDLIRIPTNGGARPGRQRGGGGAHRGVLGGVVADTVTVLEVDPQVLDRLARPAWPGPGARTAAGNGSGGARVQGGERGRTPGRDQVGTTWSAGT